MPNFSINWDADGEKRFETGNKKGVLYVMNAQGTYEAGVAWNGLTAVTLSNSGAEETALWADDIKYASLRSAEEFGATIEAYQCPDEFYECDGTVQGETGVFLGQQTRKHFGFSYVTTIGNDTLGNDYGYKIHLIYNASANPSERSYQTINESPDAITLSWEITTTPTPVAVPEGSSYTLKGTYKNVAHLEIDSTKVDANKLATFEAVIYGNGTLDPRLPLPGEVLSMFAA